MERIEGNSGSTLYFHQNFLYRKNKLIGETLYFRCIINTCRGKCIWRMADPIIVSEAHNHEADENNILALRFRQELRLRASLELRPLRQIYDALQLEDQPGALAAGPYNGAIQKLMERARGRAFPPVPENLEQLHGFLSNPQ